jgi:hypothetical protein
VEAKSNSRDLPSKISTSCQICSADIRQRNGTGKLTISCQATTAKSLWQLKDGFVSQRKMKFQLDKARRIGLNSKPNVDGKLEFNKKMKLNELTSSDKQAGILET